MLGNYSESPINRLRQTTGFAVNTTDKADSGKHHRAFKDVVRTFSEDPIFRDQSTGFFSEDDLAFQNDLECEAWEKLELQALLKLGRSLNYCSHLGS